MIGGIYLSRHIAFTEDFHLIWGSHADFYCDISTSSLELLFFQLDGAWGFFLVNNF